MPDTIRRAHQPGGHGQSFAKIRVDVPLNDLRRASLAPFASRLRPEHPRSFFQWGISDFPTSLLTNLVPFNYFECINALYKFMNINFDKDQKQAIKAEKNAVVSAGAGSGKTTVLAERFCHLIENKKAGIDEILTLTFTQKAKAEMYEKIYKRLAASQSGIAYEQLSRFNEASISTLDSFCAELARTWSSHFGIAPDFAYVDSVEIAEKASLDFILENKKDPHLVRLIREIGFETVFKGLLLDFAINHIYLTYEPDFDKWYALQIEALGQRLQHHIGKLNGSCTDLLSLPPVTPTIGKNQAVVRAVSGLDRLARDEDYPGLVRMLTDMRLTKPGGKASENILLMKNCIDDIKSEVDPIISIARTLESKDLLKGIFGILGRFVPYYQTEKRSRSVLDYNDVARIAVATLLENKPLRQYYKTRFKYIVIDEFQDNNILQKELLYLLSEKNELSSDTVPKPCDLEPGKLFFVGDEKQSIYRFRGADVSVFKHLGSELIREGGESIHLATNYRSEPGLISFFNGFFKNLMEHSDASYEARFEPLLPHDGKIRVEPSVTVLYKPYDPEKEENEFSNDESEAFAVASFVSDAVRGEKLLVRKGDVAVSAVFDDCAVLMRSTSNQIIYERMFRLFDIPFITQGARSIFLEAPLNDFYNLLQTALFPDDRVAYAALLRSPLVNISDRGFIDILSQGLLPFEENNALDPDDRTRFAAGKSSYEHIKNNADKAAICELVDFFWFEAGYRYFILKDERFSNYLEYYHYMTSMARNFDDKQSCLAEFLDFIRGNLGKYEKLEGSEILKSDSKGVKLLTIHKSKGLEFPIVILANTGNTGRPGSSGGSMPYFVSESYGPTFNLGDKNYFYSLSADLEEKEEIAELKRLLYVAFTRAQTHLVISGVHNARNRNTDKTHLNMISGCLGFGLPESGRTCVTPFGTSIDVKIIEDLTKEKYYKKTKKIAKNDPGSLLKIYENAATIDNRFEKNEFSVTELNGKYAESFTDAAPLEFPAIDADSFLENERLKGLYGSLCHEILHGRIKNGAFSSDDVSIFIRREIPQALYNRFFDSAFRLADNFISSGFWLSMRNARKIESEFEFMYNMPGPKESCFINGIVDLFCIGESGAAIVDFKTDAALCKEKYQFQLAFYRLALESLYERSFDCFLFSLRSGEAIRIDVRIGEHDVMRVIKESRNP
jgi:ATP-dependent exoDNAse (exonuclease V) beta subunit